MTPAEMDRQAHLARSRGDVLMATIWAARAACTRSGRIVPEGCPGWAVEWERKR